MDSFHGNNEMKGGDSINPCSIFTIKCYIGTSRRGDKAKAVTFAMKSSEDDTPSNNKRAKTKRKQLQSSDAIP